MAQKYRVNRIHLETLKRLLKGFKKINIILYGKV